MILSLAGTTQFDELAEAIDRVAPQLDEPVVIQTGYHSTYAPKNCTFFTFTNNLLEYLKEADIVIAHGGAGITFEVLNLGKTLIAVENPHMLDAHQKDLLGKLSREGYLIWCKDLKKIKDYIEEAKNENIRKYMRPECEIGKVIGEFVR